MEVMEELVQIVDFPLYHISRSGVILNTKTGRMVAPSLNQRGHLKVGLYDSREGKQKTRLVAGLVARAFVPGENDIFNTPQHLNGDLTDCSAENLVWRPRWHSYQYHLQFGRDWEYTFGRSGHLGPVVEMTTNTLYQNLSEAVMDTGVLFFNVMRTINYEDSPTCWPLPYRFRWLHPHEKEELSLGIRRFRERRVA